VYGSTEKALLRLDNFKKVKLFNGLQRRGMSIAIESMKLQSALVAERL